MVQENIRYKSIVLVLIMLWIAESTTAQKRMTQNVAAVNGTTLYYEMKGKGFPIVLVSGGGILDRRGWDKEFEQFSRQYKAIRYDVRGIGKSGRPTGPFSHAEDLYALLAFLRIPHMHVIGLSAGAAIAIDFAIAHPDMVDHLVLASPALSNDATAKENLQSLAGLAELVKSQGIEHAIDLTLNTPFVLSPTNRRGRKLIRTIYRDNVDVFETGFPLYALWQPLTPPAQDQLFRIRAKVLILRGDKDNADYSALTDKISRGISQAETVVIVGGTHFLHLEKPTEFLRLVEDFLKR